MTILPLTFTFVDVVLVNFEALHDPDADTVRGKPEGAFMVNFRVRDFVIEVGTEGALCCTLSTMVEPCVGELTTSVVVVTGDTVRLTTTSGAGS